MPYLYLDGESCLASAAKGTNHEVRPRVHKAPTHVESHTSTSPPYLGGRSECEQMVSSAQPTWGRCLARCKWAV